MDHPSEEYGPVNLVCSNLRQHSVWASTATHLLQSDGRRWREAHLGTHDIALSIPDPHTEHHEVIRLLLLSPADIKNSQTLSRVNQLRGLHPPGNAALVFLLQPQEGQGTQPAMQAFMELHIRLTTTTHHHLPIIPLPTLPDLPTSLQTFQTSLAASREHSTWLPAVDAARDLLPSCAITTTSTNTNSTATGSGGNSSSYNWRSNDNTGSGGGHVDKSTALSPRTAESLSRVFFSFRELLEGIGTEDGQREVKRVIGEGEGEGLVAFWGWEFEVAGAGTMTSG